MAHISALFGITHKAVSYTHLDVYKRQSVDSLDWKDLSASEITKRVTDKIHPGAIVPVSYTHLDVYKRQILQS